MRAANLTYNGVTLSLVKTNSISGDPVYSDDGIDYLYTKFTINIDAILNPEETSYSPGPPPIPGSGVLPVNTYVAIRHALLQPRGKLLFKNFGLNAFASPEDGAIVDANLGPFPKAFNVTRLDGAKLWHVNYVIETYIVACPFNNTIALLSNRYSQSQTIDREFYTTTTTRGYAHFRTDVLVNTGQVADAFRNQLLPPVPPQCRRESLEFGVNTKGNTIEYTVTDREVKLDLGDTGPTGSGTFITNMEGFYNLSSISAAPPDGGGEAVPTGMSMATMNVKLWGSRQASNWDLTQLAFQAMVANNKIKVGLQKVGGDQQGGIVHHFSITQSLEQNFVDVTISVKQTPVKNGMFGGMNVAGLKIDNVINDYGGICPVPPNDNMTRGDQSILLTSSFDKLREAIEQACQEPTQPLASTGGGGMAPPDYQGPPPAVTVYPTDRIPSASTRYSQDTTENPYSESKIDSYYNTDKGRWHVPQSGKKQSGSSSGGSPPEGPGLPAARMDPTSSIIDLHLPMSTRVVNWSVERYGAKPKIPAFESNNPALALLDYKINLAEVIVMLDGVTPSFRVTGRYEYAITREISSFEAVAFDIPQFIDYPYGEITLNFPAEDSSEGGDFANGIIGGPPQGNTA